MDEDVGRDEDGACQLDEQRAGAGGATAATSAQPHSCPHYEAHYQQMHPPLIYYDDQAYLHHHSHLSGHNQVAAANQHHPWEPHQDHLLQMPVMIPFGDTSSPNCFSTTTEQQLPDDNEPVVVISASSRSKAATGADGKTAGRLEGAEDVVNTAELVQLIDNENLGGENASTPSNRELHNEIERRRRSRIKHCCEVLKTLVPGLTEKTDKATVLEHTVNFVAHLVRDCQASKCNCVVSVDE